VDDGTHTHDTNYTGFHSLGGLYDPASSELQDMRKSGLGADGLDTAYGPNGELTAIGTLGSSALAGIAGSAPDHSHKDWPDNSLDQLNLLSENPYADSLYYHSTRMSFLLTGITVPDISEKASNHRGMVRMLILRPRMPSVRTRWSGSSAQPHINVGYPPHFDTDLFYTKTKTLGGRMDNTILTRNVNSGNGRKTHLSPSFGLKMYADVDPNINQVIHALKSPLKL